MSDFSCKDEVRERDGYACVWCGMSNKMHLEEYGQCLEVHRLVPGIDYQRQEWCITLCVKCHKMMPRRVDRIIFWGEEHSNGVCGLIFNTFHPEAMQIISKLKEFQAEIFKQHKNAVLCFFGSELPVGGLKGADYCI